MEPVSDILLITIGSGMRVIDRAASGEQQTVNLVSPVISGGFVYYGCGRFGDDTDADLRRYGIRTRKSEHARIVGERMLDAIAPTAGGAYALSFTDSQPFKPRIWHLPPRSGR
jgi:hypothetical protein